MEVFSSTFQWNIFLRYLHLYFSYELHDSTCKHVFAHCQKTEKGYVTNKK